MAKGDFTATDIAAKLIDDNKYALRNVMRAKRTNNPYAADRDEWTVWAIVSDVVEMAHGFTSLEAQDFIRILVGEV
jgi:predicted secreted hydrolase